MKSFFVSCQHNIGEDQGEECVLLKDHLEEVRRFESWIDDLQSGMYINCVYCGHRYGPMDNVTIPMRKQLEHHISLCTKHPLSIALKEIERLKKERDCSA